MLGGGEDGCLIKIEIETDGETDQVKNFGEPNNDRERESGREGMCERRGEKVMPRNKLSSGSAGEVMSALCASMISVVSA